MMSEHQEYEQVVHFFLVNKSINHPIMPLGAESWIFKYCTSTSHFLQYI